MAGVEPHPELPLDPDVEVVGTTRPLQFVVGHVLVVAAGGAVGTVARSALITVWSASGKGFPVAVFAVNVAGAFAVGLLVQALARGGPDEGTRRVARLLLATGFCGGFTTYSTLAMGTVLVLRGGQVGVGLGYCLLSALAGPVAAAGGFALAGAEVIRSWSRRTLAYVRGPVE